LGRIAIDNLPILGSGGEQLDWNGKLLGCPTTCLTYLTTLATRRLIRNDSNNGDILQESRAGSLTGAGGMGGLGMERDFFAAVRQPIEIPSERYHDTQKELLK